MLLLELLLVHQLLELLVQLRRQQVLLGLQLQVLLELQLQELLQELRLLLELQVLLLFCCKRSGR